MAILAHQGGWDEILLVIAPLVLFAVLLLLARRRVGEMEEVEDGEDSEPSEPSSADTDRR